MQALDGRPQDAILLSNGPIMVVIGMVAPMSGATPTSAALYSSLGSLSYSLWTAYMYAQSPGNLMVSVSMYAGWQYTMGFGTLIVGSLGNIIIMASSVLVSVERKATLAECEAVSGLLDIICDAVVQLNETGTIISPSRNLSNLLLLSGAPSLQGRQLQELLHRDEDKRMFGEFLSEEKKTQQAVARHLDMQDSWGNPVRMELYSVTFSSAKSKAKYLVGIKEDREYIRPTRGEPPDDTPMHMTNSLSREEPSSMEWEAESNVSRATEERFSEVLYYTLCYTLYYILYFTILFETILDYNHIRGHHADVRQGPRHLLAPHHSDLEDGLRLQGRHGLLQVPRGDQHHGGQGQEAEEGALPAGLQVLRGSSVPQVRHRGPLLRRQRLHPVRDRRRALPEHLGAGAKT